MAARRPGRSSPPISTGSRPSCWPRARIFPSAIAARAGVVYWLNRPPGEGARGSVRSVPASGGAVSVLASKELEPFSLVVTENDLFWTSAAGVRGSVKRLGLGAGHRLEVFDNEAATMPAVMSASGGSIYWTERKPERLVRRPAQGGEKSVVASGQPGIWGVVADAQRIYWVTRDAVMKVVR